jgi:hypothetical protein
MRHKLFCASCMVAVAVMGAAPAYADATKHPSDCGGTVSSGGRSPGNAATSPGSIFNEPGINSPNGGTGNQASPGSGSPSQYDTACARVTANNTKNPNNSAGTPNPSAGTPNPMLNTATNNAQATRPISHTGSGTTK